MMKRLTLLILVLPLLAHSQRKGYTPKIEPCACAFKADTAYHTKCAYLVVPEDRTRPKGRLVKLPFIIVESNNPNKRKDPVLFSGGGPGQSSLHPVTSIARRSLLKDRDYIAFEQRGTQYALPCLDCDSGISEAVRQAYLRHQSVDSMVLAQIKRCRAKLAAQGIDLSAYNTDESTDDIEDLRGALKIDSLNLLGISYSGGLMMNVLHQYPEHIRSLVLDSPLPEFVNIDEQELANFNQVLNTLLERCEKDSAGYTGLKQRFHTYFKALGKRQFPYDYQPKGAARPVRLYYGRRELLEIIHGAAEDFYGIKTVPYIISAMIKGNHAPYLKTYFDGLFGNHGGASGMRFSVYCSDKMAYADPDIIAQQEKIMPYLAGFHVNDVYGPICDCWKVKAIDTATKKPFYSNVPALLGAGGMDDSCRPLYNDLIHQYLPNSQRVLFAERQHAPLLNSYEGDLIIGQFLDHPNQKITSEKKEILVY
ncbi:MAG TPA: alpha/beta fold hydrolase [Mucilaginibacter sp.]|nr:alpha/beta fold hydrolase [Mucilaginibacter sp.]